jgi:hypothetical protein
VAKKVDPFAKAIHDLCVEAGADCPAARKAADTSVKRSAQTSTPRRRLTVAEAERMCRGAWFGGAG